MLAAKVLVLRFKDCRVDSRRNYSHPAAGFGDWASRSDFSQPVTVCSHACSTISICPQFPRMRSVCQESVCRPSQDRTWIARVCLVGVAIASTIKKAAAGHVPHIVDADHDTHSARQRLEPTRNVEPVGYRVQMDHVHSTPQARAETTIAVFRATAQWTRKHMIGEQCGLRRVCRVLLTACFCRAHGSQSPAPLRRWTEAPHIHSCRQTHEY